MADQQPRGLEAPVMTPTRLTRVADGAGDPGLRAGDDDLPGTLIAVASRRSRARRVPLGSSERDARAGAAMALLVPVGFVLLSLGGELLRMTPAPAQVRAVKAEVAAMGFPDARVRRDWGECGWDGRGYVWTHPDGRGQACAGSWGVEAWVKKDHVPAGSLDRADDRQ